MNRVREILSKKGLKGDMLEFGISLRKNAFNKNGYHVNTMSGLLKFKRFLEEYTETNVLSEMIPAFQRDNNKWTLRQKQLFILNALKGVKSVIMLFTINNSLKHRIIDGYQRVSAIYEFLNGDFKLENGIGVEDVKRYKLDRISELKISIMVYDFDNMVEAVHFYIEMNENITHSKEDIDRAKEYLRKLNSSATCRFSLK